MALEVLPCEGCGGPAEVPGHYREAQAAVNAAQAEIDRATALWREYMARSVPRWTYRALTGLGLVAVIAAYVLGLLAGCRQCGAPLARTTKQPLFMRCLFCGVDNLLGLGAAERVALATTRDAARQDAEATRAAEALRGEHVATLHAFVLYVLVPLQSLPLIWALLLPDSWQALFGLGVASWSVLLATMLLAAFQSGDPKTGEHLGAAGVGLLITILHCVFVGTLG